MNPIFIVILAAVGLLAVNGGMQAFEGVKEFLQPAPAIGIIANSSANVLNVSSLSSEVVNESSGGNATQPPLARITATCRWQQWKLLSWLCPAAGKVIDVAEGQTDRGFWLTAVGVVILALIALFLKRLITHQ